MKIIQSTLGDLCEVDWGNTNLTKSSYVTDGKFLAVSASGPDGRIDHFEHEGYIPVLSAIGAQCGKMFFPTEKFTAIKNTITLTPLQNVVDGKYLYYLFTHIDLPQRGAGQPFISKGDIQSFKISIPKEVKDQQGVVEKLDKAFAEIDSLEKNLQLKEEKTNQLLQSILSAAFTNTEEFDMKVVKLESIVDILDNLRQPINSTERSNRIGKIPYYGATGQVGTIDKAIFNENLLLLGEDGVPFFDRNKHKAYEISGPSWVNNHAHVLRAKPSLVIQKYLLYFLNNFNYSGYVNGATRLKLTQGDMKRIPVLLPSLVKQEIIVEKLDKALAEIDKLKKQILLEKELIYSLRQSILSNAFNFEEKAS